MGISLLIGLIVFVVCLIKMWDEYEKILNIFCVFSSALISIIVIPLVILLSCAWNGFFIQSAVLQSQKTLIALRDKDGVQGQFFLGTGQIKNEPYYFYYVALPDGGYSPEKMNFDEVTIYEENRKDAVLLEYHCAFKNKWAYLVSMPMSDACNKTKVHVPKGTIRRGFSI
jgi:hypothetical protein